MDIGKWINLKLHLKYCYFPIYFQIMDWICLLLDANFTVVVMIPEAKSLLLSLYKFVKSQVCNYLIYTEFILYPSII